MSLILEEQQECCTLTLPSPLTFFMKELVKGAGKVALEDDNARLKSIPNFTLSLVCNAESNDKSPSQLRFKASNPRTIDDKSSPSIPLRSPSHSCTLINPDLFTIQREDMEGSERNSLFTLVEEEVVQPNKPSGYSSRKTQGRVYHSLDEILFDRSEEKDILRQKVRQTSSFPLHSGRTRYTRNFGDEIDMIAWSSDSSLQSHRSVKLTRSRTVRSSGNMKGARKAPMKGSNRTRETGCPGSPRAPLNITDKSARCSPPSQPRRTPSHDCGTSLEEMQQNWSRTAREP